MVRTGARVERSRHPTLGEAMEELERRGRDVATAARVPAVDLGTRRFEPAQRVAARLELRGPGRLTGGVDVRGDGALEPFSGRLRRRLIEQLPGESAWEALGHALDGRG